MLLDHWFLDVFRRAGRGDFYTEPGRTHAADALIGIIALVLGAVMMIEMPLRTDDVALASLGFLLLAGTLLVACSPGASDVVLVAQGLAVAALFALTSASSIVHLVEVGPINFRHGPGLETWLLCHASLHFGRVRVRGRPMARLPGLALAVGLAADVAIAGLLLQDCLSAQ